MSKGPTTVGDGDRQHICDRCEYLVRTDQIFAGSFVEKTFVCSHENFNKSIYGWSVIRGQIIVSHTRRDSAFTPKWCPYLKKKKRKRS